MLIISIGYFSIREEKTQAFFHDFFYFFVFRLKKKAKMTLVAEF